MPSTKVAKTKIKIPRDKHIFVIVFLLILVSISAYFFQNKVTGLQRVVETLTNQKDQNLEKLNGISEELTQLKLDYEALKSEDPRKKNSQLQENIKNIENSYDKAVSIYEDLLTLKDKGAKTSDMDKLFAESLNLLSDQKYNEANDKLASLQTKIKDETAKIVSSFQIPQNVPANNAPPGSGYSRQSVNTDKGTFMVSLVAADIGTTKVIVDTASDSDCGNNCPVLPLATYVSRSGAYAGINGSYFCPASYPSCAGKTNSFDLLVMNKNKTYFNSGNNVYSNNPAVIFGGSYIRFVSAASQWGRDTGIDGMLSNYPMLVQGGNIAAGASDDTKMTSKGARSFVSNKGNTVYIGVVHNASVAESASVMKAMGMENALNLDNGGSTALWSGGYKVGPGRDLPNVILFVRK